MNSRVPDVRFEGFVEPWETQKLCEIADVFDGTHQTPRYTDSGVMFLSVENIETLQSSKFISLEDFLDGFKITPKFGDVLMTRIGDIGTTNVVRTNKNLAYYVSLALLKPKEADSDFLATVMQTSAVKTDIWERTLHVAFPKKINLGEVKNIVLCSPDKVEQTAIGNFFRSLDEAISLEKQQHDKMVSVKKAMLEKMFPKKGATVPEIRFEGFTEPWATRQLDEFVEFYSGLTYSPVNLIESGGTLILRSSNVKDGEIINADNVYVKTDVVNCFNVSFGDVIVVVRNGSRDLIGKHAQIKTKMENTSRRI